MPAESAVKLVIQDNDVESTISLSERIQELQRQANQLAHEHVKELIVALYHAATISEEIQSGGDAYLNGVKEVARKLAEDLPAQIETIQAIIYRATAK